MSVTFTYSTSSISLRNPQFPDSCAYDIKNNYQRTMFGSIYTYIKTPINKKHTLLFNSLTDDEFEALESFLDAYIDKTLTYVDQDSVSRTGSIVNNPLEDVQERQVYIPGSNCTTIFHSVTIEFEER